MPESNTDSDIESATLDAHLSALASAERRCVLYYFQDAPDDVASLEDLAEFVEANAETPAVGSHDRVVTRLHHHALPKLAESGVLEYDERDGVVRYRGSSDLESLVTLAASAECQEA